MAARLPLLTRLVTLTLRQRQATLLQSPLTQTRCLAVTAHAQVQKSMVVSTSGQDKEGDASLFGDSQWDRDIASHEKDGKGNGKPKQFREGDWVCPTCHDHVFGWRQRCRCGAARPKSAPPRRTTKPPMMRKGDWQCPACGDHVFAFRMSCRSCGTPRPQNSQAQE
eukprot:m.75622 g.75622  ORF g.75622 m.75622 type:complete len:166 (-) comp12454_c1_seq1:394-891(-)